MKAIRFLICVALVAAAYWLTSCATSRNRGEGIAYTPDHLTRQEPRRWEPAPEPAESAPYKPSRRLVDKVFGRQPKSITPAIKIKETKESEKKSAPTSSNRGFLSFVGRKQTKETVQNSPYFPSKKCKGCTINLVAGSQTNSSIGKKAGPAVVASDGSTLNAVSGGGNLAAQQGNGNSASQTKQDTTKEAAGIGATIAGQLTGPLGIMLAIGAGVGVIILVAGWRKKKQLQNLT